MAKKCPKCECPAGEKWAVPFADFLSLLLALFIALYALASVNLEKQKALKEEFMKIYGTVAAADTMEEQSQTEKSMAEKETESDIQTKRETFAEAISQLDKLEDKNAQGGSLQETEEGTVMSIPAQLLFEKGKANLFEYL
jgi:chemotaxis protein MotB